MSITTQVLLLCLSLFALGALIGQLSDPQSLLYSGLHLAIDRISGRAL